MNRGVVTRNKVVFEICFVDRVRSRSISRNRNSSFYVMPFDVVQSPGAVLPIFEIERDSAGIVSGQLPEAKIRNQSTSTHRDLDSVCLIVVPRYGIEEERPAVAAVPCFASRIQSARRSRAQVVVRISETSGPGVPRRVHLAA